MEPVNNNIQSTIPVRQSETRPDTRPEPAPARNDQAASQVSISAEARAQQANESTSSEAVTPAAETQESANAGARSQANEDTTQSAQQANAAIDTFRNVAEGPKDNNLDVIS